MATPSVPPTIDHLGESLSLSFEGYVVDDFGLGVAGAGVSFRYEQATVANSTTDEDGRFEFPNVKTVVGEHSVFARAKDFKLGEESFVVRWEMSKTTVLVILRIERGRMTKLEAERRRALDEETEAAAKSRKDKRTQLVQRLEDLERLSSDDPGKSAAIAELEELLLREYNTSLELLRPALLTSRDFDGEKRAALLEESLRPNAVGGGPLSHPQSGKENGFLTVEVLFATDRARGVSSKPLEAFKNERSKDGISFGICELSIPNRHLIGKIERPSIFRLEFSEDPKKHIILRSCELWDDALFYSTVNERASNAPNRDVFFFIHGYAVTFAEAVFRTAQMAVDLNFTGVPICYSWPSRGRYKSYVDDEATIGAVMPHLLDLLKRTAELEGVKTIHLVAHSMGNRALANALKDLARERPIKPRKKINQVVLAAPDIDRGEFLNLAEEIAGASKRLTLYASSTDIPLRLSRRFHGYPRAGEAGDEIVVGKHFDTIDASGIVGDILGHSNFSKSRTVLHDIYDLFAKDTPPPRFGLKKATLADKLYWIFLP